MFDIRDAAAVMLELKACRKVHAGRSYIRLCGLRFFAWLGELRMSFIVERPSGRAGLHPGAQRGLAARQSDTRYLQADGRWRNA